MMMSKLVLLSLVASAAAHGAVVTPRARQSVDYLVEVNVPKDWPQDRDCVNITGSRCDNGQAPFWYSQGCFIGCPHCDHLSGRRNVDLCGLGKVATLPLQFRTVNLNATAGSEKWANCGSNPRTLPLPRWPLPATPSLAAPSLPTASHSLSLLPLPHPLSSSLPTPSLPFPSHAILL